MGTVSLFTGLMFATYSLHRYVRKSSRIKKINERNWHKEAQRPYIERLENPKTTTLNPPKFEYDARD